MMYGTKNSSPSLTSDRRENTGEPESMDQRKQLLQQRMETNPKHILISTCMMQCYPAGSMCRLPMELRNIHKALQKN